MQKTSTIARIILNPSNILCQMRSNNGYAIARSVGKDGGDNPMSTWIVCKQIWKSNSATVKLSSYKVGLRDPRSRTQLATPRVTAKYEVISANKPWIFQMVFKRRGQSLFETGTVPR